MAIKLMRFKKSREKRKLSRAHLSGATGLSTHTIMLADTGQKVGKLAAEALARVLGVKVVSLK